MTAIVKRFTLSLMIFVSAIASASAFAIQNPLDLMEGATQRVISVLNQDRGRLKSNPNHAVQIIDRYIAPHFDFVEMSRWVVGRNAWTAASRGEQDAFVRAFRNLVIRTYSKTLNKYESQTIEYLPLRGSYQGKSRIEVRSYIHEAGKEDQKVAYRLIARGNTWKVYDVVIEGVSIVKGFQSQFAADVKHNGLGYVAKKITSHNRGGN